MRNHEYGSYGIITVAAVSRIKAGQDPVSAWQSAAHEYFSPEKTASVNKSCPKSAFLGLCEAGKVKCVAMGHYTRSKKNKAYALAAYAQLKTAPNIDKHDLWDCVADKAHNGQMDVLFALYETDELN